MATGRLGTSNITSTSATAVYGPVPASTFSVVTVNIVNRNASTAALIRIAVSTSSSSPSADEWIEYDSQLVANGVLERTGIVMDTGKYIIVQTTTSTPTLSAVVMGIETPTA